MALTATARAEKRPEQCYNDNVSLGGLGTGRIAYWLKGCGLQNRTCDLFSLKPRCDNSAVNF